MSSAVPKFDQARTMHLVRYYRRVATVLIIGGFLKAAVGLYFHPQGDPLWWVDLGQLALCFLAAA